MGQNTPSPCPTTIPSPILGGGGAGIGWAGWVAMGGFGSSRPTAPHTWDVADTQGSVSPGKGWGELCHHVALSSPAVMKFMGDHPLRGQTELDAVCTILKVNPPPER